MSFTTHNKVNVVAVAVEMRQLTKHNSSEEKKEYRNERHSIVRGDELNSLQSHSEQNHRREVTTCELSKYNLNSFKDIISDLYNIIVCID